MNSQPPKVRVGVLYSRVRVEEKLLFEAFEKRGVDLELLDVHGDPAHRLRCVAVQQDSALAAHLGGLMHRLIAAGGGSDNDRIHPAPAG